MSNKEDIWDQNCWYFQAQVNWQQERTLPTVLKVDCASYLAGSWQSKCYTRFLVQLNSKVLCMSVRKMKLLQNGIIILGAKYSNSLCDLKMGKRITNILTGMYISFLLSPKVSSPKLDSSVILQNKLTLSLSQGDKGW